LDFLTDYARYEYALASGQLIFAMLGMGALLAPRDFLSVARAPKALLIGLGLQLLAIPVIAASLGAFLPMPAGIAAGLVLVAAVPGGTMSNVITLMGRGNIALSISLTGITTVGALAITPLILRLLIGAHLPADFEMPVGRVAWEIGMTLLLPLFSGMAIGAALPAWRETFSRGCVRTSLGIIGLMVIGGAGSGRLDASAYGAMGPIAIFAMASAAQAIAWLVARLTRLAAEDRLAVMVEVTVRNTNLALLIKASIFPAVTGQVDPIGDGMFFVALLYGGAALFMATPPVVASRRSAKAMEMGAAEAGDEPMEPNGIRREG
jgi:BASS family bile acid:Na+ symporter